MTQRGKLAQIVFGEWNRGGRQGVGTLVRLFSDRGGRLYLDMKFIVYTERVSLCLISSYANIVVSGIASSEILLS